MTPVIEAKRDDLTAYKANPSEQNLQILRAARSKVQQCARQCANDYWLQLCSQIQIAADTSNIKVMYDNAKQALGPTQKPWNLLPRAKPQGTTVFPPKCCIKTLIAELHEILCLCLSEGKVPQHMRDANVVTLYKNKGDRIDCNNYRGASLLSVVGKVFVRAVLKRLQVLAEQVYPKLLQTWYSPSNIFRRNVGSKSSHSLLPSYTSQRLSIWSLGTASSWSFPILDIHPNFSASSDPSMKTWKAPSSFSCLQHTERSETGLRPGSHLVWNLLCCDAETRIWSGSWRYLPPNQDKRKALQPLLTKSQD